MSAKDFEDSLYVSNYLELGYLALERDDAAEALRCAGKALEADDGNASAWLLRMCALMLSGNAHSSLLEEIVAAGNKAVECAGHDERLKQDILALLRDLLLP